ncbi:MAG: MauE/DoxX family redox-associated membrane protein [Pseudomonadales bacterium]
MTQAAKKSAVLYRKVMPKSTCPHGVKSLDLLRREGYDVDDRHLTSIEETDTFRDKNGVTTTPQIWINDVRIGGHDDLLAHFGRKVPSAVETSYRPIIVIFTVAALMAMALGWFVFQTIFAVRTLEWFIAISMCFLAIQKLQDIESFSSMFLNYDLLAKRWLRYAYLYPYGEAMAGVLMISGALVWVSSPIALFIGSVGFVSVFKAVYIEKRELKCACVGGNNNVPLGFVSLTENVMMIVMGTWMLVKTAL